MLIPSNITCWCPVQFQALEVAMEESKQAEHRAGQEHQHDLAALQAQCKNATGEMEVLRAGAGHAKDQALAALKVSICTCACATKSRQNVCL